MEKARRAKVVGFVILLPYRCSIFVTDPKGELAAVTAKHQKERFGQDVFFLNPWARRGTVAAKWAL